MQHKSTLFKASVIAMMALTTASLSAQKVNRNDLKKQFSTSKVSFEQRKANEARQIAAAPLLKYSKVLNANKAVTPFAAALERVKAKNMAAQQPVILHAPASNPNSSLVGYVNYAEDLDGGMYSIQMPAGDYELLGSSYYSTPTTGAYVEDGKYYSINVWSFFGYYFFYPVVINLEDMSDESPEGGLNAEGYEWYPMALTTNPQTGKGFGIFYSVDASAFEFCNVDVVTGERQVVGESPITFVNLATAGDGTVYGVGGDNNLYKVDVNTGALTEVGPTGFYASDDAGAYSQDMAIDSKTGACYWFAIDADGADTPILSVDLATGAATRVVNQPMRQVLGLYAVAPAAEDDAPAAVTDLAAAFNEAELTGTITFTAPSTTFGEAALEGDLAYTIVCGAQQFTGTAAAGSAVSQEITVEEGNQLIVVTTANAAGTSPKAKLALYVGQDTPLAPANVAFAYDKEAQAATITWDAVTEGVNNGYLGAVTYNVYDPAGAKIAEGISETTYTVAFAPESLGNFAFAVEALAGDKVSALANSNGVVIGSSMNVPVTLDYTQETALSLSTVIDANNDGKTWVYGTTSTRYPYNSNSAADDWLLTPAINLVAGRTYVLTYTAWSQSNTFPETLEVTVGAGATVDAQTQTLVEAYIVPAEQNANEIQFTVPADGEYNIGFHAISDADMFYLNLGLVTVEAGPLPEAPAAAELAIDAADGALDYNLVITLPTKNIAGEDLAGQITKILVSGAAEVELTEGYAPGSVVTVPGTVEANGTYTWTVVCYNEAENGLKSKVSKFLGQDAPANVVDAVITDLGTSVRLDWSPVTTGLNGGYVDPSQITYQVFAVEGGYVGDLLVETAETTATIEQNTQEGELALLQYAMRAVGPGGESGYYGSSALVIGEPDALPWIETFANGSLEKFVWTTRQSAALTIDLSTTEGDGGAIYFTASEGDAVGSLVTGKIALAGAQNPEVTLDYKGTEGASLDVVIATPAGEKEVIATVTGAEAEDWQTAAVVIPAKFVNEPYVLVYFTATIAEANATIYIDNLNVRDVLEYNLSLQLSAPESLVKGETTYVIATVTNEGAQAVENAEVKFTINGEVSTVTYGKALESFQTVEFPVEVSTTVLDEAEAIEIEAEAVYALDLKPEDNIATAVIELKNPTAAPVENLAGELTADGLLLSWNGAAAAVAEQTEDFESWSEEAHPSTPCTEDGTITADWNQVDTYNDWTFYDLDGGMTYGWEGVSLPFTNYAFAYGVINYSTIGQDNQAHSGEQVLIAISNTSKSNSQLNDDWLVSPELPGIAQTISFWYNELTDQYGNEKFEVLYSTTDAEPASFTKVDTYYASTEWQQLSVDLPEGTKYFAVRYCANDIFILQLDDFTYTAGTATPESYNIYCDGQFVANTAEESYLVSEIAGDVYAVTAVYANGSESLPMVINVADIVGIQQIAVKKAEAPVYNLVGVRVSEPKAGIYVTSGKKIAK